MSRTAQQRLVAVLAHNGDHHKHVGESEPVLSTPFVLSDLVAIVKHTT